MTRLTVSLAAATLTLSLAPQVQAYATDAETATPAVLSVSTASAAETCQLDITPVLAVALGLPPQVSSTSETAEVACAAS